MATVANMGLHMGITISTRTRNGEQPSTTAASSTSMGRLSKYPFSIHTATGRQMVRYTRIRPG